MTQQKLLALSMVVAEAIRDLGSVPSGHLYAQLMSHMDIDTYNNVIDILTRGGLVTVTNHLIVWQPK